MLAKSTSIPTGIFVRVPVDDNTQLDFSIGKPPHLAIPSLPDTRTDYSGCDSPDNGNRIYSSRGRCQLSRILVQISSLRIHNNLLSLDNFLIDNAP